MGLDISIIEYKGKDKDGYLIIKTPEEKLDYSSDRYTIRKQISSNIEFKVLSSGKYYDEMEYYRPKNFKKAYEWCNSLEKESDRNYIQTFLKDLEKNDNYYLEYS